MSLHYEIGTIVWVRLGQKWWPARVTSLEECPTQYTSDLKKEPLAVVRFFNESEFHDVAKPDQIFPYNCSRKDDFIRKGLNSVKYDSGLSEKFEADVAMAEKLTGGDMDIIKSFKATHKRRIDYSDLGFATSKAKKRSEDKCMQRAGFSDIGEAIQYKRGLSPLRERIMEHRIKIMEQPKQKGLEDEMRGASNWFKCYACGFTCGRLNVIIWHNKVHLKKVEDYDSGIRMPRRRKRKQRLSKSRDRKKTIRAGERLDHAQTNGHASPKRGSQEASQLLLDWDDDEEPEEEDEDEEEEEEDDKGEVREDDAKKGNAAALNGVEEDTKEGERYVDDEDDFRGTARGQRRPMPRQVDINSAFDALLAESSPLQRGRSCTSVANEGVCFNNDSDSDCSDWEKYYARDSESEDSSTAEARQSNNDWDVRGGDPKNQNGFCELSPTSAQRNNKQNLSSFAVSSPSGSFADGSHKNPSNREKASSTKIRSPSPSQIRSSPPRCVEEPTEEHSTHSSSSSSSSSSGPAYMLVAVDAHGNNVPMPVLSEGGNHLVAVEASMEDGTTRTLYIDPAHLGPNVDLNNLMLHIDNSGQETVIIPTSTSDGELISSTLVDQSADTSAHHDSASSSSNSKSSSSSNSNNSSRGCHDNRATAAEEGTSKSTGSGKGVIQRGRGYLNLESETKESTFSRPASTVAGSTCPDRNNYPYPLSQKRDEPLSLKVGDVPSENCKNRGYSPVRKVRKSEGEEMLSKKRLKEKRKVGERRKKKNWKKDGKRGRSRKASAGNKTNGDSDDLPDLEINVSRQEMFPPNEVVWVLTHGLWWPSFVLKVYRKESKASILFINCQQKTPIKVSLNRMKTFSYLDYTDIFESQKDKAVGLTEAMEMASYYRNLKEANAITETPRDFFRRPLTEQRSIINRQTLILRGVPLDMEILEPMVSSSDSGMMEDRVGNVFGPHCQTEITEDCLSERERIKLASATKARRTSNERFIRFIHSDTCLSHLREISSGRFKSPRHQYFKDNYLNPDYLMKVTSVHNPGLDFFGQDMEQTEDVLTFLLDTFESDLKAKLHSSQRKLYINTVLFPEAIKQALRTLANLPEEDLEVTIENGLSCTRTEKKAKQLQMECT